MRGPGLARAYWHLYHRRHNHHHHHQHLELGTTMSQTGLDGAARNESISKNYSGGPTKRRIRERDSTTTSTTNEGREADERNGDRSEEGARVAEREEMGHGREEHDNDNDNGTNNSGADNIHIPTTIRSRIPIITPSPQLPGREEEEIQSRRGRRDLADDPAAELDPIAHSVSSSLSRSARSAMDAASLSAASRLAALSTASEEGVRSARDAGSSEAAGSASGALSSASSSADARVASISASADAAVSTLLQGRDALRSVRQSADAAVSDARADAARASASCARNAAGPDTVTATTTATMTTTVMGGGGGGGGGMGGDRGWSPSPTAAAGMCTATTTVGRGMDSGGANVTPGQLGGAVVGTLLVSSLLSILLTVLVMRRRRRNKGVMMIMRDEREPPPAQTRGGIGGDGSGAAAAVPTAEEKQQPPTKKPWYLSIPPLPRLTMTRTNEPGLSYEAAVAKYGGNEKAEEQQHQQQRRLGRSRSPLGMTATAADSSGDLGDRAAMSAALPPFVTAAGAEGRRSRGGGGDYGEPWGATAARPGQEEDDANDEQRWRGRRPSSGGIGLGGTFRNERDSTGSELPKLTAGGGAHHRRRESSPIKYSLARTQSVSGGQKVHLVRVDSKKRESHRGSIHGLLDWAAGAVSSSSHPKAVVPAQTHHYHEGDDGDYDDQGSGVAANKRQRGPATAIAVDVGSARRAAEQRRVREINSAGGGGSSSATASAGPILSPTPMRSGSQRKSLQKMLEGNSGGGGGGPEAPTSAFPDSPTIAGPRGSGHVIATADDVGDGENTAAAPTTTTTTPRRQGLNASGIHSSFNRSQRGRRGDRLAAGAGGRQHSRAHSSPPRTQSPPSGDSPRHIALQMAQREQQHPGRGGPPGRRSARRSSDGAAVARPRTPSLSLFPPVDGGGGGRPLTPTGGHQRGGLGRGSRFLDPPSTPPPRAPLPRPPPGQPQRSPLGSRRGEGGQI